MKDMKKKVLGLTLGIALAGATIGGAVAGYAENNSQEAATESPDNEYTNDDVNKTSMAELVSDEEADAGSDNESFSYSNVADVAEDVMPSIVSITNKSVQEVQDWFSRQTYQMESESAGSGIIIGENDTELLICTNNHVVEDSDTLTVTFIDDESYEAQVKGTDKENDLAVVAVKLDDISDDTRSKIKIAKYGDSDSLRVGEQVVAIGNALGYGQSVTTGIVSALNRDITASEDGSEDSATTYQDLIQTDAAINPGNSGGALLNMNGEVIGINSAKASESGVEGMGYAIPISKAMPILENLMSKQTRSKVDEDKIGYLGINGQGVSDQAVQLYNVPAGVYVTKVQSGSPADKAGLREGDIITKFDGTEVSDMSDLQERLQYYSAGETVELTIQTNKDGAYAEKTLEITLGSRSQSAS
jgi:serine protease Do